MFVTHRSRSTKNTRGRSHSKGSDRPEQSVEGAGIKSPSGFDWRAALAPRNLETLDALQSRRPQERISDITGGVGFSTTVSTAVDPKLFAKFFFFDAYGFESSGFLTSSQTAENNQSLIKPLTLQGQNRQNASHTKRCGRSASHHQRPLGRAAPTTMPRTRVLRHTRAENTTSCAIPPSS